LADAHRISVKTLRKNFLEEFSNDSKLDELGGDLHDAHAPHRD
jgi:hypothetical protein